MSNDKRKYIFSVEGDGQCCVAGAVALLVVRLP